MAENSYSSSNASLGAVPRYDSSRPVYNNDAYSQMFQGDSAYGNQNKTGFRQAIPKALSDTYYDIPEYKISALDYTKPVVEKEIPKPVSVNENNNDSASAEASRDANLDMVNNYNNSIGTFGSEGMVDANRNNPVANPTDFYGNPVAKEVNAPPFNALKVLRVVGMGSPVGFAADIADTVYGQTQPAVPTSGYGTPGTYSSLTGNYFDSNSRGIDSITGQYKDEYGTQRAWTDKIRQDPFDNIFGDPDKAEQGDLTNLEYAGHRSKLSELAYGARDPMGNPVSVGLSKANEERAITKQGTDMGFPAHTVAPGTPTFESIKTGRYVKGSQFFPSEKDKPKEKGYTVTKGPLDTSNININDITTDYGKGGNKDFSDINSENSLNQNVSINTDTSNNDAADDAADAQQARDNARANANAVNNYGNNYSNDDGGTSAGGPGGGYGDSAGSGGGVGDYSSGGKIPPISYANKGEYIGQPTGKQTIVGRDIYSSPITGPMGNLVGSENASEKGSTMEMDGQYGNIPSIHNGMEYGSKQLYQMMKDKEIPNPTAYYDDEKKAVINSIMRSRALDGQNVMSMEHLQRDPFEKIFRSTK